MKALRFIKDHVIFKFSYNQIYQMKTPYDTLLIEPNVSGNNISRTYKNVHAC